MLTLEAMPAPPEAELRQPALSLAEEAKSIQVTAQTYAFAANKLLDLAAMRRKIQDYHAPLKQKAHEAHQAICKAESSLLAPVLEAERVLKIGIGSYDQEQRCIAEEADRQARIEAERRQAEELEASIEEAEAAGASEEEVQAIIDTPMVIAKPVTLAPAIQQVAGVSTAVTWHGEIDNMGVLLDYLAKPEGKQFRTLVQVNQPALNQLARALKSTVKIPGVRFYSVANVRASGGRR